MKAKDIKPGDVFVGEGGVQMKVTEANKTRAFKVSLAGHPNSWAIMVSWKGRGTDVSLYHPNEDVGEPLRRAKEVT